MFDRRFTIFDSTPINIIESNSTIPGRQIPVRLSHRKTAVSASI